MPFLSRTGFAFGDDFLYKSHMEILCQTEISQKPCRVSQKPCRVSKNLRVLIHGFKFLIVFIL